MENKLPRDSAILLSYVNTKLRDFYKSFDEMCSDMELDKSEIENSLAAIGYTYKKERNQFV